MLWTWPKKKKSAEREILIFAKGGKRTNPTKEHRHFEHNSKRAVMMGGGGCEKDVQIESTLGGNVCSYYRRRRRSIWRIRVLGHARGCCLFPKRFENPSSNEEVLLKGENIKLGFSFRWRTGMRLRKKREGRFVKL